jgi:predicted amidohydrolase
MRKYLVGVVQMDTRNDKAANMKQACAFIDEAAARGVKLVAFPENISLMDLEIKESDFESIPGYTTEILMAKAKEHGLFINCGSIKEAAGKGKKPYNTSVLIDDKGTIIAKYRKLHLFDVTLPEGTETLESSRNQAGSEIVQVETELGNLGLTICYDIRFPELYRILTLRGAQIIFTPANFTTPTGKDHWEAILKARAIENGCYIVAPAQIGAKMPGFSSFGSSLVVDPWGTVIARAGERPGLTVAEIDLDYLDKVRGMVPSLKNRRADVYEVSGR